MVKDLFGPLLTHPDAVAYADTVIGASGQIEPRVPLGALFKGGHSLLVADSVLRHGLVPPEYPPESQSAPEPEDPTEPEPEVVEPA